MGSGKEPTVEHYDGSDCTGVDGAVNRTLTLSNTIMSSDELVSLSGNVLQITTQYTISHNAGSTVITFLVNVWDTETIYTLYFT